MGIVSGTFILLIALTLAFSQSRGALFSRKSKDWILDGGSLLVHFLVVPFAQTALVYYALTRFFPGYHGIINLPGSGALLLNLLGVDYCWYWNHRIFHLRTPLWNLHGTHHSATHLDVLATARNAFWSPFLMVYLWLNALGIFLLKDPTWFLIGGAIGASINLWGHTSFGPKPGSLAYKIISLAFITPHDHFWHHSTENPHCNFGTVFNFWDKIHGTWFNPGRAPAKLGFDFRKSAFGEFLDPFELWRSNQTYRGEV